MTPIEGAAVKAPQLIGKVPPQQISEDEPRLSLGNAGRGSELAEQPIEIGRVAAGDPELKVEAAGEEGDLLNPIELGCRLLEVVRSRVGQEPDVDQRRHRTTERARVDRSVYARDHAFSDQPPHAIRHCVWAQPNPFADENVAGTPVRDEDSEDFAVNSVHLRGKVMLGLLFLRVASPTSSISAESATTTRGFLMRIGVPTEIKPGEGRVAVTPAGVRELVRAGSEILIQAGAGVGSRLMDAEFAAEGARIVPDADTLWAESELIMKVKGTAARRGGQASL